MAPADQAGADGGAHLAGMKERDGFVFRHVYVNQGRYSHEAGW